LIAREIVVTCSHPEVARAAMASIGGDFAEQFSRDAESRNLTSGLFAAKLVNAFARKARQGDWAGLHDAIRGADMPILSGLRFVLDRAMTLAGDDAPLSPIGLPPAARRAARPSHFCA